jgi:hypothetical protein
LRPLYIFFRLSWALGLPRANAGSSTIFWDEVDTGHGPIICGLRDNHRFGDEVAWWGSKAIDPMAMSRKLWVSSRGIE